MDLTTHLVGQVVAPHTKISLLPLDGHPLAPIVSQHLKTGIQLLLAGEPKL
jgi:hypothetical protein